MSISSLEVDFDKSILKINGKDVVVPTLVTLPDFSGWDNSKVFNSFTGEGNCQYIEVKIGETVIYDKAIKKQDDLQSRYQSLLSFANELEKRLKYTEHVIKTINQMTMGI